MSSVNETSSVGNTRNTSTATKDLEEEVQNLLKKNSQLSADLAKCLKTITRLRRQRSALLDVITLKRQESHDSNDDDDDDDSSVYDEDRDLGDLSEPTEESSSEEEDDNDVEFKPPSRIRTVLNRTSTLSSKRGKARHRLVHLPKDTNGNYVMPVKLGNMILISLGEIDPSPQYYNSRYIFPVGYTCKRPYKSIKDPNTQVMYTSYIKRGTAGPKFCLFAEDDPDNVVESDTPTGAWTTVMREVHQNSNRTYINCSGPEYFGLSNPNVILMIQELPNADKCEGYIWRDIEKEDGYGVVVDAPLRKRIKTEPGTEPSSPNSPTYARRSMAESNLPDTSSPDDTGSMISTEDTERPSTKRRRR